MRIAKILSFIGFLVMTATITYGFVMGDFWAEGSKITSIAWGQVSLIDVYIGFAIFSGWVIYREKSWLKSLLWIVAIIILGNMTTCLYLFIALMKCENDAKKLFMGNHIS